MNMRFAGLLLPLAAAGLACAQTAPAPQAAPKAQPPAGVRTSPPPDARILGRLEWFQDQKFGFLMHWGAYSVTGSVESWPLSWADRSWGNKSIQTMEEMVDFRKKYWDLPRSFNPVKFDPKLWASLAKKAGMKYVVFTTKHHDGFNMFDTKLSDYKITSPEFPFSKNKNADVTLAIFNAFRAQGIAAGAYFSKPDWHSPYYWRPEKFAENRNPNYDLKAEPEVWAKFAQFVYGQIEELVTRYGRVDILWLDGGQVRPPNQDINMERLVAMARSHQPDVLVVNRAARGYFEDYRTPENTVPKTPLLDYPWESCVTMARQWSYKANDQYKSTRQLIQLLVDVVAKGGNLLLNVGPSPEGELPAEAVTRMKEIGEWMAVNSEAIYGTRVVAPYREGQFAFTKKGNTIYAIYLPGEKEDAMPAQVTVPTLKFQTDWKVQLLGSKARMEWHAGADGTKIDIPASVQKAPPTQHAYAFKITGSGIAAAPK